MLSLGALGALLSSKAFTGILGLILSGLVNAWTSRQRDLDAEKNAQALGEAIAAARANKEAADAATRMSEVNAQPRSQQTVIDRLGAGSA